jgi:hypothetical protein
MAAKRTFVFLYLTLACFAGIIAIFIVDGYMGVYDTVYVTAGEQEQRIDPDFWLAQDNFTPTYYIGATNGTSVSFRYQVDNRRFSGYSEEVQVSVWRAGEKVLDVLTQSLDVPALARRELDWVVHTADLGAPTSDNEEFSLVIRRGEVERRIILNLYTMTLLKPAPPG